MFIVDKFFSEEKSFNSDFDFIMINFINSESGIREHIAARNIKDAYSAIIKALDHDKKRASVSFPSELIGGGIGELDIAIKDLFESNIDEFLDKDSNLYRVTLFEYKLNS